MTIAAFYIALLLAQVAYSFLSTCRVNDAVKDKTFQYVVTAGMSDIVKYGITAGMAYQVANNGQWWIIATTVMGGVIGNTSGHLYKKTRRE